MKHLIAKFLPCFFIMLVTVNISRADLTPIGNPPSGEATIVNLLDNIYGSGFSGGQNNASYTNGAITATRVDDDTDQWWNDASITAVAKARFAGYGQSFGYNSGSGEVTLFSISGSGYAVTGSASVNLTGDTWQWIRTGVEDGHWSSVESNNYDQQDHMITFLITGLNTDLTTFMLCWEDKTWQTGSDWDYNDMVIEVQAQTVPVPGAILLGLLGLGATGMKLRRFA